ncbi:hypothetical protein [Desulfofundulus salinus]|uniref:hypothetical protein n=1 Tax=Desulfofundulus salinus TaxID=2419843 RepID=UPI0014023BCE|nr:hypothetical protein [Desulfofundulus salinum]
MRRDGEVPTEGHNRRLEELLRAIYRIQMNHFYPHEIITGYFLAGEGGLFLVTVE